jgi:hypothetical protein
MNAISSIDVCIASVSCIFQQDGFVPALILVQDSIVLAILQHGLGNTFATLSVQELAWCRMIVELPHHQGGIGITTLPSSGMAAFYSVTAQMVSGLLAGLAPSRLSMGC